MAPCCDLGSSIRDTTGMSFPSGARQVAGECIIFMVLTTMQCVISHCPGIEGGTARRSLGAAEIIENKCVEKETTETACPTTHHKSESDSHVLLTCVSPRGGWCVGTGGTKEISHLFTALLCLPADHLHPPSLAAALSPDGALPRASAACPALWLCSAVSMKQMKCRQLMDSARSF